jgi:hypothetical protein
MTKEIVRYAIIEADGSFVMTFPNKESAECSSYNRAYNTIVKLTGTLPEPPKKPRLLAPALAKWHERTRVELTLTLYESEEAARKDIGKFFIAWPAVANADGMFEVPS